MSEATTNTIDQHAMFEDNVSELYRYLKRQVRRLTRNETDAEEITQTAFVQFLGQMDKKGWDVEFVRTYLVTIARNVRNDLWKARAREQAVSYDDDIVRDSLERDAVKTDDSVTRMDANIYYKELYDALPNVIMNGVSDYELELIQLRRVDGLSIKEIASVVGRDSCQVRYELQKVEARIRHRARKIMADKTCDKR